MIGFVFLAVWQGHALYIDKRIVAARTTARQAKQARTKDANACRRMAWIVLPSVYRRLEPPVILYSKMHHDRNISTDQSRS